MIVINVDTSHHRFELALTLSSHAKTARAYFTQPNNPWPPMAGRIELFIYYNRSIKRHVYVTVTCTCIQIDWLIAPDCTWLWFICHKLRGVTNNRESDRFGIDVTAGIKQNILVHCSLFQIVRCIIVHCSSWVVLRDRCRVCVIFTAHINIS